jgi:hypothetical protein
MAGHAAKIEENYMLYKIFIAIVMCLSPNGSGAKLFCMQLDALCYLTKLRKLMIVIFLSCITLSHVTSSISYYPPKWSP